MQISKRAIEIQASPIRKLMPYANAAHKKGIKVYHLNIGQPDIETPKVMMDVFHNFEEKVLSYGPSQGLDIYRKGLVHYYAKHNIPLEENEIIVTTAGSEAIVFAMLVVCNEGDEIIVPEPFYTNYNGFSTMAGINLNPLTTFAEDGFVLPADEKIETVINSKTKAIMICNPGNPTGTVYSKEEIFRLAAIARKYNLFIIADEVYREFVYDGFSHTSIMHVPEFEQHAILVDSISKRYSACGARIGCIISKNKTVMDAVLKFAQARLCPPTIDQLAANACAYLEDEYIQEIQKEYQKRRDIVYAELQQIPGLICRKPHGAFYIIAKIPVKNTEDFIIWMLSEFQIDNETVMTAPCEGFYATPGLGRDELRIAYILHEDDLRKAMHIFRTGLEKYIQIHG